MTFHSEKKSQSSSRHVDAVTIWPTPAQLFEIEKRSNHANHIAQTMVFHCSASKHLRSPCGKFILCRVVRLWKRLPINLFIGIHPLYTNDLDCVSVRVLVSLRVEDEQRVIFLLCLELLERLERLDSFRANTIILS